MQTQTMRQWGTTSFSDIFPILTAWKNLKFNLKSSKRKTKVFVFVTNKEGHMNRNLTFTRVRYFTCCPGLICLKTSNKKKIKERERKEWHRERQRQRQRQRERQRQRQRHTHTPHTHTHTHSLTHTWPQNITCTAHTQHAHAHSLSLLARFRKWVSDVCEVRSLSKD